MLITKKWGESMLDERKLQVLYAIINSYIFSAEPIGSRTISKNFGLGVSSATIRNEMSDLEDLGYLSKPHTSSGRVPSELAYRYYVNDLLSDHLHLIKEQNKRMKDLVQAELSDTNRMIESATKVLSALTKYTAIGISPQRRHKKLKRVQLLKVEEHTILCLLVFETNEADNFLVPMPHDISEEELNELSVKLSRMLFRQPVDKAGELIRSALLGEMKEQQRVLEEIIPLLDNIAKENAQMEVNLQGVGNIFNYPEFNDIEKARDFVNFLENKENIYSMLEDSEGDLIIRIGKENIPVALSNSSVVLSTLHEGDEILGHIGIIGPMRMDYKSVLAIMWTLNRELGKLFDE